MCKSFCVTKGIGCHLMLDRCLFSDSLPSCFLFARPIQWQATPLLPQCPAPSKVGCMPVEVQFLHGTQLLKTKKDSSKQSSRCSLEVFPLCSPARSCCPSEPEYAGGCGACAHHTPGMPAQAMNIDHKTCHAPVSIKACYLVRRWLRSAISLVAT